ncbi:MAG: DUF427 domain-containing protein [Hyphomicrobiales bacterium]
MAEIVIAPYRGRVRVSVHGESIAESDRALELRETGREPVIYIPMADVRMDRLKRTTHRSLCPYKGIASYWSILAGDEEIANAVWAYEDPISTVAEIAGHVAFYPDRVDAIEAVA